MKKFLLFLSAVFLYADIFITGHIHVGDNYFDNYNPTDPISYGSKFMYLDYPTNFYITKDMDFTGVELVDAQGIESDSNIKVYIDGNLVGTGRDGANKIIFDNVVSLKAGYHTIAVRGSCYKNDKEVSCNRRNVDNDDFYFKYYQLFSSENDNAINFDERIHVGDSDDDSDYYDDLSDDDAIPFWYPDSPQAKRGVEYILNLNCNVNALDINITRIRDVYKDNLDYVKLYVNDNLVKEWGIKSNGRYAEDLFYSYKGNISKDDNVSLIIINDYANSDDLDDISWDDVIIIPHCVYPNSGNFDVWDEDENISTKIIKTKIVSKKFDLTLASLNKDGNEEIPFSGTVCTRVVSKNFEGEWNETHWNEDKEKNISFNIKKAIKISRINIRWNNDKNESCPLNDYNETNSTDDFAIRPDKFDIANIPDKVKSGSEFNLTIKALDNTGNSTKDYNETLHTDDNSVKVEYNTKSGCDNGELNITDGEKFKNGETNATFVYNEVGDLNITIKEINGSEFAKVDEDDTPDNQRFITSVTKKVIFIPHHFKADVNISNYDENFTYLDNNLNIYSLIDLNITAENEQNETTKNYNTKCYAKDIDVNLTPNIFRHDENLSKDVIYKVYYVNSESKIYKNKDINFSVGEGNFTTDDNGSAFIKIYVNFERNLSNPENPFEYNISNVEINDSDVNNTYEDINGSSLFYYGYINMNDIITTKNDFNISHEFIVYDENSSDNYLPNNTKEIIINWYLNNYNKQKDANVSNFVVTKNYVYNDEDVINSVDVEVNDINESLNLHIKRNDDNVKFAVIHIIDTNASQLWYSHFAKEYNISKGSSCAQHFCFSITWKNNEQKKGVITGDTNGTKSDINSSKINKKGVKIFR